MFDSTVICLGSNIQFKSKQYPVHTTVYQEAVDETEETITEGCSTASRPVFISSRGIKYYFPAGQQVVFSREMRSSRNQKDAAVTNGAIEQVYFDHGTSPGNAQYEYAISIPSEEINRKTMAKEYPGFIPDYKLINKDSIAHIVNYLPGNITAASIFEKSKWNFDTVLSAVTNPCLLMYRLQKDSLEISITDPDLRFYEGKEDIPTDENGKRKEVSIYSRKWITNSSKPGTITIELTGWWKLVKSNELVKTRYTKNGRTELSIVCKYGEPSTLILKKNKYSK